GVQTCALPIFVAAAPPFRWLRSVLSWVSSCSLFILPDPRQDRDEVFSSRHLAFGVIPNLVPDRRVADASPESIVAHVVVGDLRVPLPLLRPRLGQGGGEGGSDCEAKGLRERTRLTARFGRHELVGDVDTSETIFWLHPHQLP